MGGLSGKGLKAAILGGSDGVSAFELRRGRHREGYAKRIEGEEECFVQSRNREESHVTVLGLCSLLDKKFFDGVI